MATMEKVKPKNTYKEHQESLSIHEKIAVRIGNFVGSMACAYIFCLLALISLPAAIASHDLIVIVGWIAQTFLQLVLLSIIMVSQNLQNRHTEMRAEHEFELNIQEEKQNELILNKLDEILKAARAPFLLDDSKGLKILRKNNG